MTPPTDSKPHQTPEPKPPEQLIAARWRSESVTDAATWDDSGFIMPSGRRRSGFRLLRGKMGLVDLARADGALRGSRGWWTLTQIAAAMFMAERPAADTLAWLEQLGWLTRTRGATTEDGSREPDMWRLVLPTPKSHGLISAVTLGQKSPVDLKGDSRGKSHKSGGKSHPHSQTKSHRSISTVTQSLVTLVPLVKKTI